MERYSTNSAPGKTLNLMQRMLLWLRSFGASRKRRISLQIFGSIAISLFLGWLVIQGLEWGKLYQQLRDFPIGSFTAALGVFLVGIFLRAWRWHVLIVNEPISFMRLFLIQNAGIGLNNLSPIRVVSEPLQLALVTRRGGMSAATALATLAMEHIMDVFATAALLGIGVWLLPELRGFSIQLVGAVVFAGVSLIIFFVIAKGMNSIPGARRVEFLQRAIMATRSLGRSPIRLGASLGGTFAYWVLLGLSGWITAQALGIEVGVAAAVVLFMGSVFIVSAVPSPPGGAITFEAAVVYTLHLFGVSGEPALAFALIMHVIMFVPSTMIAFLVLPGEGIKMFGRTDPTVIETVDKSEKETS